MEKFVHKETGEVVLVIGVFLGWNDFNCGAVAAAEHGCPDWKPIEGYKGKETFKEIESKRRI